MKTIDSEKKKRNTLAAWYSVATIICTFIVGQILLWLFPDGSSIWASLLFILINLIPMITAGVFSIVSKEEKNIGHFLKQVFIQREKSEVWILMIFVPVIYYGVSILLHNVNFTGSGIAAFLAYLPWTLLQGGLEEVGWRWYLQAHISIRNSFVLKMLAISVVWFLWHIPVYRLPWITAGSSNYLIFYLMILGNTFTLGAVRQKSKGAVPCIAAHMLIDSLAVIMLVQSSMRYIVILVAVEILLSILSVYSFNRKF